MDFPPLSEICDIIPRIPETPGLPSPVTYTPVEEIMPRRKYTWNIVRD